MASRPVTTGELATPIGEMMARYSGIPVPVYPASDSTNAT